MAGAATNDLSRLTVAELSVLYDAVSHAADAFVGVLGQPRCAGAAHEAIEDELERCNGLTGAIINEVKSRRPDDKRGRALRLQMLTTHYISDFSQPLDVIRFVTALDEVAS